MHRVREIPRIRSPGISYAILITAFLKQQGTLDPHNLHFHEEWMLIVLL